jgi:hypothetical protein
VHMVGHNDSDMQRVSDSVVVQAAAEGDVPCPVGQLLTEFSNECDEVRFVVALKMRQVATIEGHAGIILPSKMETLSQKRGEICGLFPN